LPYTLVCGVKSRPDLGPTLDVNREKKKKKKKKEEEEEEEEEKKLVILPKQGCLATYVPRVSTYLC
jgi:hypothetical protein